MPSFDRVCHNIYISASKGGFPCCNSTRYQWWSESLYLKWWATLLHDECTTHFVKVTLYKLQYPQQSFLQSLESDQTVPFIKTHTEIIALLCAWLVWVCAKSRNHQDNAIFVLRGFWCCKFWPQVWKTPVRARSELSLHQPFLWPIQIIGWPKHLCFRTYINYGWSPKIMTSIGSSINKTAFLDCPPSISYSVTCK